SKSTPAHVSLVCDVFEARLEPKSNALLGDVRPIHAFGLSKNMERRVELDSNPEWTVYSPPRLEGEKAPDNRTGTDRVLRLDAAIQRATARFSGGGRWIWSRRTISRIMSQFFLETATALSMRPAPLRRRDQN